MIARGLAVQRLGIRVKSSFTNYELSNSLVDRLDGMGIKQLTEIQEKALPVVMQGCNAIINAETGCGKTLCFLLPIVNRLMNSNAGNVPCSFILVPTAELAVQIHYMFVKLSDPRWKCSAVFSGNRLMLTSSTKCVVGVPSSLLSYDLKRLFKSTSVLAVDEADMLLTGGELAATWRILKLFRASYEMRTSVVSSLEKQMIFSGATIPSRGKRSALMSVLRWLPKDAELIQTERVHSPPPNIEFKFVELLDDSSKPAELINLLLECGQSENLSLLVFTNSVMSCESVFHSLHHSDQLPMDRNCIARLDKSVGVEKRHLVMRMFIEGEINVLICTDLFARGIDMPHVKLVVLYDFPSNSADFLHRIGRTARAGKSGRVVSFVLPSDKKLAAIIQHKLLQTNSSFDDIFSRNKMLKRRIDKLLDNISCN